MKNIFGFSFCFHLIAIKNILYEISSKNDDNDDDESESNVRKNKKKMSRSDRKKTKHIMDMTKKNPVNRSGADEILFNDFYNRQSNKHLEYENNSSGRKNESREIPI